MRLRELAALTGVPTATIKYYLRLGLLHAGRQQSATWAEYDASHVRRLTLVRALADLAGLPLDAVRRVLAVVDDESVPLHHALGTAQWLLSPDVETVPTEASARRVEDLLARRGWRVDPDSPHRRAVAATLDSLEALSFPADDDVLDRYAAALEGLAQLELDRLGADADRATMVERLVIGTLLYEPLLAALRRMAHEAESARRSR